MSSTRGPEAFEEAVRTILAEIGEDPERQGLQETPARVRRMFEQITDGYWVDPDSILEGAQFDVDYDEMVVVRDIELYSLCEHHLVPFFGHAHVGYLPRGKVIGLSKIPRVVDLFAHRLQVQERMTSEIAQALLEHLAALGAGCVVRAVHTCMEARGVGVRATMETSALLGAFRDGPPRAEFLALAIRAGA